MGRVSNSTINQSSGQSSHAVEYYNQDRLKTCKYIRVEIKVLGLTLDENKTCLFQPVEFTSFPMAKAADYHSSSDESEHSAKPEQPEQPILEEQRTLKLGGIFRSILATTPAKVTQNLPSAPSCPKSERLNRKSTMKS